MKNIFIFTTILSFLIGINAQAELDIDNQNTNFIPYKTFNAKTEEILKYNSNIDKSSMKDFWTYFLSDKSSTHDTKDKNLQFKLY